MGILDAPPIDPVRAAGFGSIEFYGHSLTYTGASAPEYGLHERVSSMLHAEDLDRSVPGSLITWHETPPFDELNGRSGGWAHAYRFTENDLPSPSGVYSFEAKRDLALVFYGINDLSRLGLSNLQPLKNAFEAVISRLRAAVIYEETFGVTYSGGTWTNQAGGVEPAKNQSGPAWIFSSTVGAVATFVVPASFPGGAVAIAFLCANDGSGALWDMKKNGILDGQCEARNVNAKDAGTGANGKFTPVVYRFHNVAAGDTLTATINAVNGAGLIDGWWPEGRTTPLIVVPLQPRINSYSIYTGRPYVPTDSGVATMNTAIQAVVSTFDSNVLAIDVGDAEINKQAAYFASDGIHFNDRGHGVVARYIVNAITRRRRSIDEHAGANAVPPHISRNPDNSVRNRIEATRPEVTPATFSGRNAGDQTAPLAVWELTPGGTEIARVDPAASPAGATSLVRKDYADALGATLHVSGSHTARLAATPTAGILWKETDTGLIYRGTGSAWAIWKGDGFVAKTADETVNNSATLQNDDHLFFPIEANEVWFVEALLQCSGASVNADWKFGWVGPTGATAQWSQVTSGVFVSLATGGSPVALSAIGTALSAGAASGIIGVHLVGWFSADATHAGTIQFQWAQATATAENNVLKANSKLRLRRLS